MLSLTDAEDVNDLTKDACRSMFVFTRNVARMLH